MTDDVYPIYQLLKDDPRYPLEAYQFVREALAYAQDVMKLGDEQPSEPDPSESNPDEPQPEHHLTGQQLCQAIRQYAVEQYGYMAKVVLKNWGFESTGDFGNVVYNLIGIGWMRKSENDRREHFDNVFDFDEAFEKSFEIELPD